MINRLKDVVQQHSSTSLVSQDEIDDHQGYKFTNSPTHSHDDAPALEFEPKDEP